MTRKKPFPISEKFGRLTVVKVGFHNKKRGSYHMICECDCGETVSVREDCLTTGNTKSCGCLQKESAKNNSHHGMWNTRVYSIWAGMKTRCKTKHKKSHLYGNKGVSVCKRWEKFEHFLEDMGLPPSDKHSIDRIDGNGNYEPSNCRWATAKQQANNMSSNKLLTFKGKTQTLANWSFELGIKSNTLAYRLLRGWSIDRAFTQAVQKRR